MSFLGGLMGGGGGAGGVLGSGQIVIGAHTAGLVSQLKAGVKSIETDLKGLATDAQVQGTRTAQGINRIGTAAERNAAQVRTANVTAGRAMTTSAKEAEAAGARWGKVFSIIGTAAKVGMLGVVAAVGIGVKAAADFQKQWAAVVKTVGGSPKQMENLRQQFLGMAQTMPVGLGDLAKIGETAGALGIPIDQVKEFTRVVAMIGATTNVSVDQAATAFGTLGNVLHLRQKDYERFGSTLVDLGNKGASTEKQILQITERAGAAGKLLGLRAQDILAISSTVASLGIAPEAGGTSLQTIFLKILEITNAQDKQGASSKKLKNAQESLRIAEMKLAETRGKAHVTASQVASAELRVSKARDAVTAASAKGKNVQADLAKVAGMTVQQWKDMVKNDPAKAFERFIAGMGKLTAPQQLAALAEFGMKNSRVERTVLGLANNQGELARQLGIADTAWEKNTALQANYEKKTANLNDRLKILFNIIQVQLIKLGDMVLPTLSKIVEAIAKGLPDALNAASRIWESFWKKVGPPIGEVLKSVGHLITAFSGPDANKPMDWAKAIGSVFDGVANIIGTVARAFAAIIDVGAKFVESPLGQWAKNILIPLGAVLVALSGIRALAGKLTGWSTGLLRGLASFIPGFLKPGPAGAKTPEAEALMGSAKGLSGSAAALKAAAGALSTAAMTPGQVRAFQSAIGGLPGGGTIAGIAPVQRTRPMTTAEQMAYAEHANLDELSAGGFRYPRVPIGSGAPGIGFDARGRVTSVPISGQGKADYLFDKKAMDAAGRGIVERTQMALASGVQSAAGGVGKIKSLAGNAFGAVKGVGSLIAKAFWPLFLLDMATEFLKQPAAEFVAANTPFKNAAAEMATDFWGGAADLLISALNGTDAWVGHANLTTIGKAKISTLTIAKLGFTSAEIGSIQAPTLTNGGFTLQQTAADAMRDKFRTMTPAEIIAAAQTAGIDTSAYSPTNAKGRLGNGVLEDITNQFGSAIGIDTAIQNYAYTPADVQPLVDKLVNPMAGDIHDRLVDALQTALDNAKIDVNAEDLPKDVQDRLVAIFGGDIRGKRSALTAFLAKQLIDPHGLHGAAEPLKTSRDFLPVNNPQVKGAITPGAYAGMGADVTAWLGPGPRPANLPVAGRAPAHPFTRGAFAGMGADVYSWLGPGPLPPGAVTTQQQEAAATKAYRANIAGLAPRKAAYETFVQANAASPQRAELAASGQRFIDNYGAAIKDAKSDKAKLAVFNQLKSWLPTDQQALAAGAKGPSKDQWAAVQKVYVDALAVSGVGARQQYADIWADIIRKGAADGSKEATPAAVQLFMRDFGPAIQAAMDPSSASSKKYLGAKGKGAKKTQTQLLQDLGLTLPEGFDPTKYKTLGDAITAIAKAEIPAANIQNMKDLTTAFLAWSKTKIDPTKIGDMAVKLDVSLEPAIAKNAATAVIAATNMGWLTGAFQSFIDKIPGWITEIQKIPGLPGGKVLGPPVPGLFDTGPHGGGGGRAGQLPAAGGAFFDTRGVTHMTVGEAGGETVAVIKNPRRFMLPDMRMPMYATPGVAGAGAGGGRTQQIFADKIQVLGPSDEQSLLARFAFLSNQ